MSYEEAIIIRVSAFEAKREIAKHAASWEAFIAEHGDRASYSGATVLEWLGY